jgi:hypothetical protein
MDQGAVGNCWFIAGIEYCFFLILKQFKHSLKITIKVALE